MNPLQLISATPGALSHDEALRLFEMAQRVLPGRVIVEIGSWHGKSTVALALGSKAGNRVKVYSVDPHEDTEGAGLGSPWHEYKTADWQQWYQHVLRAEVPGLIRPVGLPSEAFIRAFPALDERIGLLFIDGCHRYEVVHADAFGLLPYLDIEEGRIVFDDRRMKGPQQVIRELAETVHWKFFDLGKMAVGRPCEPSSS